MLKANQKEHQNNIFDVKNNKMLQQSLEIIYFKMSGKNNVTICKCS